MFLNGNTNQELITFLSFDLKIKSKINSRIHFERVGEKLFLLS